MRGHVLGRLDDKGLDLGLAYLAADDPEPGLDLCDKRLDGAL